MRTTGIESTDSHRKRESCNKKRKTQMQPSIARTRRYITKMEVFGIVSCLIQQLLVTLLDLTPSTEDVAKIIVNAAASRSTINAVARRGKKGPKAPAIRYHCRKLKGKGAELEKGANALLRGQARSILNQSTRYEFVIDGNDKEIYTKRKDDYIVKSKAKNGTNRFISHATLYAIAQSKRVTVSFMRMRKKLPRVEIVKALVEVLKEEGYCTKRLYLDRGFYSVEIVQYLQSEGINAIIAMPIKGEKKGLKSRLHGKKSHWIDNFEAHTTVKKKKEKKKLSVTHTVAAISTYQKGSRGKKGVRWYAYAVIGDRLSLKRIKEAYRGRFGIETSYRIKNQSLGWTTSPMPEMRTLYFVIALLIQNEWVRVNWFYFRERRRGRPSGKPVFPFGDFLELLLEGCRTILGRFDKVEVLEWRPGGPFGI